MILTAVAAFATGTTTLNSWVVFKESAYSGHSGRSLLRLATSASIRRC